MAKIKINSELFETAVTTGIKLNFNLLTTTTTHARTSAAFNEFLMQSERVKSFQKLMTTLEIKDKFPARVPYVLYVTFGQRYREEKHIWIPEVHPDGWIELHCNTAKEVNMLRQRFLGNAYGQIQFAEDFKPEFYPKGCLRVLTIKDLLEPISLTDHLD